MTTSQVPGPDLKSLGGQCLHVTAKLPCLSKSSDNLLPSHGPGQRSGTTSTPSPLIRIPSPLTAPLCLTLWGCGFSSPSVPCWTPSFFWPFSMSLSVFRYLFVELFLGISFSTFLHVSFFITEHLPSIHFSSSPPGSLFLPFYAFLQATHSHFFLSLFCFLLFNKLYTEPNTLFKIFMG